MSEQFPEQRWFEDFAVGQEYRYGDWELSLEQMLDFARLYDPEPFHLDREAAIALGWRDIIASGPQLASLWRRLSKDAFPLAEVVISPGWDRLRWLAPVYPGDRIRAESRVVETRRLESRPGEGVVVFDTRLLRNGVDRISTLNATWFVRCQP